MFIKQGNKLVTRFINFASLSVRMFVLYVTYLARRQAGRQAGIEIVYRSLPLQLHGVTVDNPYKWRGYNKALDVNNSTILISHWLNIYNSELPLEVLRSSHCTRAFMTVYSLVWPHTHCRWNEKPPTCVLLFPWHDCTYNAVWAGEHDNYGIPIEYYTSTGSDVRACLARQHQEPSPGYLSMNTITNTNFLSR